MFGELLTAMVTPFDQNGVISTDTIARLSKKLVSDGNDGLVLAGTTGESPNLTKDDRSILYATTIRSVGDSAKVIAGTGTYSTTESIELSKQALDAGVDGIMVVTPYYSKPSQEGIYQHFKSISDNVSLPIIAYNIPGRTSKLIEIETLERIVIDTNVVAIKDAVNDISFTKQEIDHLYHAKKLDVEIYSGDDKLTLDLMRHGAKGVISVASHVIGKEIRSLIDAHNKGDIEMADKINDELNNFYDLIFAEPSPAPIKAILSESFQYVGSCKLPLIDASPGLLSKLIIEYKRIKKLKL